MNRADVIGAAYLLCAILFILGLKRLSSPATARSGNRLAAVGMAFAIVATLFDRRVLSFGWIVLGAVIGGVAGAVGARRVKMTAMPQMVALFNGFGGGAAALVALADYHDTVALPGHLAGQDHRLDPVLVGGRLRQLRRLDDRVRQAAGADHRIAGHVLPGSA